MLYVFRLFSFRVIRLCLKRQIISDNCPKQTTHRCYPLTCVLKVFGFSFDAIMSFYNLFSLYISLFVFILAVVELNMSRLSACLSVSQGRLFHILFEKQLTPMDYKTLKFKFDVAYNSKANVAFPPNHQNKRLNIMDI